MRPRPLSLDHWPTVRRLEQELPTPRTSCSRILFVGRRLGKIFPQIGVTPVRIVRVQLGIKGVQLALLEPIADDIPSDRNRDQNQHKAADQENRSAQCRGTGFGKDAVAMGVEYTRTSGVLPEKKGRSYPSPSVWSVAAADRFHERIDLVREDGADIQNELAVIKPSHHRGLAEPQAAGEAGVADAARLDLHHPRLRA